MIKKLLILFYSLLFVSACGGSNVSINEPELEVEALTLIDNEWILLSYGYEDQEQFDAVEGYRFTLSFLSTTSQIAASDNCNGVGGSYDYDETSLSFGDLSSSDAICIDEENRYGDQYQFFQTTLGNSESYLIEGDILTISANDGAQLIFEVDPKLTLENNKWNLRSYGLENEAKVGLLKYTSYSLYFNTPTQLAGYYDCFSFDTSYEESNGGLTIGDEWLGYPEVIMPPCPIEINQENFEEIEQDYLAQQSFFVNALTTAQSYSIEDTMLTVTASDSSQLIFEVEPELTLENTWNLIAYGFEGEAKSDLLEYTSYVLDLTVPKAYVDCNGAEIFTFEYDKNSLSISMGAETEIACPIFSANEDFQSIALDYNDQNSFFINAVNNAESYIIEDTILTITGNDGSQLIFEVR